MNDGEIEASVTAIEEVFKACRKMAWQKYRTFGHDLSEWFRGVNPTPYYAARCEKCGQGVTVQMVPCPYPDRYSFHILMEDGQCSEWVKERADLDPIAIADSVAAWASHLGGL